jgi:hypothetical protein
VLEALADLGGQEMLRGLQGHTVDPHQFLGLEINPRAAAIAELVLWIGYLQWHMRTKGGMPDEPILRAFRNIKVQNAVLQADRVLVRDESGVPRTRRDADGAEVEVYDYSSPQRAEWPPADFVVGNPPFIGGKFLRARLGDEQAEALWRVYPEMNESADFVMYWWDQAARMLTCENTVLRSFGFVTTNSITGSFQRRVIERYLRGKSPLSLVLAIPDHPWTKATSDAAAVRIAMTVVRAGTIEGSLQQVVRETGLDTDAPVIDFISSTGPINADLTIGANVAECHPLRANEGLCSRGVQLFGSGFMITPGQAEALGLGRRAGLESYIRIHRNGRDLTARPRDMMVIDLFGLDAVEVRDRFPEVYQYLLTTVKPERDVNHRNSYRLNWWIFGEPRSELRPALYGQPRYIVTPVTQKHRLFTFLAESVLPDDALMVIAHSDAEILGVLQSNTFFAWFNGNSSTLEDRPRFIKSRCFDPFPFPLTNDLQKHRIRQIAERIDAHRKRVLAEHPHLTLTGLYNVLEQLRAGTAPADLAAAEKRTFDDGLVLILKEDHDALDRAVAAAYGWPAELSETEILTRLVALNAARAQEEAQGTVHWLRPDYQVAKFGSATEKAELDLAGGTMRGGFAAAAEAAPKTAFPADDLGQTAAVMASLVKAPGPLSSTAIAARFRQGRRILPQIEAVLAALVWDGWVSEAEGRTGFVLRRAA